MRDIETHTIQVMLPQGEVVATISNGVITDAYANENDEYSGWHNMSQVARLLDMAMRRTIEFDEFMATVRKYWKK
jgi:hypothetical protein